LCCALAQETVRAQCGATTEWTFSPPIPASGYYNPGTTVEVCVTVSDFSGSSSSSWLWGISSELSPAWDASLINPTLLPDACAGFGQWLYEENLQCNFPLEFNAGYYYDGNTGGPQDGNPCNNYGDDCPSGQWQFCLELTLSTSPDLEIENGTDITPAFWLIDDGVLTFENPSPACGISNPLIISPNQSIFYSNCLQESGCESDIQVSVSNSCLPESVTIYLYDGNGGEAVGTHNSIQLEDNSYSFEDVETGTFDVYIEVNGYLTRLIQEQEIAEGVVLNIETLLAGDFNNDNSIGIADFSLFASAYGLSAGDEGFQEVLDIDCSNSTGIGDFSSFSSNYGLDGDDPE